MELILPPPARLDAGTAEGALPRSTQKALGRLFSACGLSADFTGGRSMSRAAGNYFRPRIRSALYIAYPQS